MGMCVCVHGCASVCVNTARHGKYTGLRCLLFACVCRCVCVHENVHMCVCVCEDVCVHENVHMCVCVCVCRGLVCVLCVCVYFFVLVVQKISLHV